MLTVFKLAPSPLDVHKRIRDFIEVVSRPNHTQRFYLQVREDIPISHDDKFADQRLLLRADHEAVVAPNFQTFEAGTGNRNLVVVAGDVD